jgi:hypothetical protein
MSVSPSGKNSEAIEGLIRQGEQLMEEQAEPEVLDAGLIVAAQKVEHYEIAGYGTVRTYAELLGKGEIAKTLQLTLKGQVACGVGCLPLCYAAVNAVLQLAIGLTTTALLTATLLAALAPLTVTLAVIFCLVADRRQDSDRLRDSVHLPVGDPTTFAQVVSHITHVCSPRFLQEGSLPSRFGSLGLSSCTIDDAAGREQVWKRRLPT